MALPAQFLSSIRGFVTRQDGDALRDWLQVDAGAPAQYYTLGRELRASYARPEALDNLVDSRLPVDDGDVPEGQGAVWPGFAAFVREYLQYWRDVDFGDLLKLHSLLSGLLTSCATALSHPTYGAMMLRTSIVVSEALCRLVMVLHRRPDLTSRVKRAAGDEERKSVVESAADALQKLFTTCLTDRSGGGERGAPPKGKKVGVYIFANLVLKLLFACKKSRLAVQMFTNIATSGPPLAVFPAAQRVTYLYYLGRFNFENNNFPRAAACLQEAYSETPLSYVSHRRLILTYLVPANMLLGRLPAQDLLRRPEATAAGRGTSNTTTLRTAFEPLAHALRKGDFVAFQTALDAHEDWLFRRGLLLTLGYRLRPLLWRSLSRRVFLLTYRPPAGGSSRRAATLDLSDLLAAAVMAQHRLEGWVPIPTKGGGLLHNHHNHNQHNGVNPLFMKAIANNSASAAATTTLTPPPSGAPRRLRPSQGLLWGNLPVTLPDVETAVASLVAQGLLHGFVAHAAGKFAVVGAKAKGSAVLAGWPAPAPVVRDRLSREEGVDLGEVPARVR